MRSKERPMNASTKRLNRLDNRILSLCDRLMFIKRSDKEGLKRMH